MFKFSFFPFLKLKSDFLLILKQFFSIVCIMKKINVLLLTFFSFLFIPSLVLPVEHKINSKAKKREVSKVKKGTQKGNVIVHRVRKGDTPARIAKTYGVSLEEFLNMNKNINPKNLKVGSVVKIPAKQNSKSFAENSREKEVYIVKKGDTLYSISKKYSISIEEIKKLNKINNDAITVGTQLILKKNYLTYKPKNKIHGDYTLRNDVDSSIYNMEDDMEEEQDEIKLAEGSREVNEEMKETDFKNIKYTLTDRDVNKLIASALDYIGASYKYGGNHPASIDCSAFVKRVFNEVNIHLPRTSREQFELGVEVPLDQLAVGDLLFFKRKKRIGHVGIYIGDNMFIHAASKEKGVIISSVDSPYFKKTFVGAKRLFIKESNKSNTQGKTLSLVEKPLIN